LAPAGQGWMYDSILRSKDNDDDKGEKKVPKGFEKFLRKTREKAGRATEEAEGNKKEEKKEARKEQKKEEDEELSEEEVEEKDEKKSQKGESKSENAKKKINEFFFQPGGKGPKWENIALVSFLAGAFGFYLATLGGKSEEITYVDFINTYLT